MSYSGKTAFLAFFLVSIIVLSGCSAFGGKNKNYPDRRYYIGTEGVWAYFADSGSPPARMYYFKPRGEQTQQEANPISINVELHNRGASYAKGAMFVSGYDPALIEFRGVEIPRTSGGDCTFDLRTVTQAVFAGYFQCDGSHIEWTENGWELGTRDLGSILEFLGVKSEDTQSWLDSMGITIRSDADGRISFEIGGDGFDFDYFNLGRGLMIVMSSIDVEYWYGQGYMLRGNTPDYPNGEEGFIEFQGYIKNWPANLDHTTQNFLITNCYGYATYASPEVCIDPQPFSQDRKVCIPQEIVFSQSQGAPVAITRVEQEPTPQSTIFTIHFKNVNKGTVMDIGYLQRCSPYYPGRLDSRHMNVIYVWDVRIGQQRLRCTPEDHIVRLTENSEEGQITCTYDFEYTAARSAYKTPLIVEAWYGYMDTEERQVYIKMTG